VDVTAEPRITLHLVRARARAPRLAETDWLVYLHELQLADHGLPPCPPGPIDHDQLVELLFAADRIITW
jgi:hypothetical protein